MDKIKIEVTSNIAVVTEKPKRITSGTIGLPVEFTFDSEWDELRKVAVFDSCCVRKDMIIKDGATVVPIENLAKHGDWLCIGVYGVNEDGSIAIPTIWANAGMIYPGAVPEGDLGSDIGTAKQQYKEAVLASERSENAANRSEAAASDAENNAGLANDAAFRADAAMVSAVSASESAQQSAQNAGASEEYIDIQKYKIDQSVAEAKNAQHYAEEAQSKAEAAAERAEAATGGGSAVLYTPQTLTAEQQAQARENIGAVDLGAARDNLATMLEESLDPIWQDLDDLKAVTGKSFEEIETITLNNSVTKVSDSLPFACESLFFLINIAAADVTYTNAGIMIYMETATDAYHAYIPCSQYLKKSTAVKGYGAFINLDGIQISLSSYGQTYNPTNLQTAFSDRVKTTTPIVKYRLHPASGNDVLPAGSKIEVYGVRA